MELGWLGPDLNGTGLAGSGSQWNRADRIRMSMNRAGRIWISMNLAGWIRISIEPGWLDPDLNGTGLAGSGTMGPGWQDLDLN